MADEPEKDKGGKSKKEKRTSKKVLVNDACDSDMQSGRVFAKQLAGGDPNHVSFHCTIPICFDISVRENMLHPVF